MTQRVSPLRLTIYVDEEAKTDIERVVLMLLALDVYVLEVHEKASTIIGEWTGPLDDLSTIEKVPGVAVVRAIPKVIGPLKPTLVGLQGGKNRKSA